MSRIAKDTVVSLEYKLTDDAGEELDRSEPGEPLAYLHGHGQIVPGLEGALEGRGAGDAFDVKVAPEDGYGVHDDEGVFKIPRAKLPEGVTPEVGMELASRTPDGHIMRFRLVALAADHVVADANHPLAGKSLHFSVKVVEVRAATAEELAHGHVHGAGGHHHHHDHGDGDA